VAFYISTQPAANLSIKLLPHPVIAILRQHGQQDGGEGVLHWFALIRRLLQQAHYAEICAGELLRRVNHLLPGLVFR
jgi:hypothetical protein